MNKEMNDEKLFINYLNSKQKDEAIKNLPQDEKLTIANVVMIMSFSEHNNNELLNEEYKYILKLLEQSKEQKLLLPEVIEIFDRNKKNTLKELSEIKQHLFESILGEKLNQYNYLKLNNKDTEAVNLAQKCFSWQKEKHKASKFKVLEKVIENLNSHFITINEDILQVKVDNDENLILKGLASIIEKPIRMSFHFLELDPKWYSFPLKWYSNDLTQPELRTYFSEYKKGKNLDKYILGIVQSKLESIENRFDSHFFRSFRERTKIIKSAVKNYREEMYESSIYTLFPLLEGILWHFSFFYDYCGNKIYEVVEGKKSLLTANGKYLQKFSVGDLLRNSNFNKFFDEKFVEYYCEELYNERNPLLHGREVKNLNKINNAKKLLTFDYLTDSMNSFLQIEYNKKLDSLLGDELVHKLLNKIPLTKEDKQRISENGKNINWGKNKMK
jgi:hypothetical protein